LKDLPKRYYFYGSPKEKNFQVLPLDPTTAEGVVESFYKLLHGEDVVVLNGNNFNQSITNGQKWLIQFFTLWCAGCRKIEGVWRHLATYAKNDNSFVVAKLNYLENLEYGDRYNITFAPTIKLFDNGSVYTYIKGIHEMTVHSFIDFVNNPNPSPETDQTEEVALEETKEAEEL